MSVTVFVQTPSGETWTFTFTEEEFKSTTVLQLKMKIRERDGTPEDQQRLNFGGWQLEDQRLLSDCGVKHEDTIHLLRRRMGHRGTQIYVKMVGGKTKTFFFTEEEFKSTTVLQLKTKIRETEGTPEHQQRLMFNGRQLEDQRLLSDDGVEQESTIHLVLKLRGGEETPGALGGGMGDREGRNQSMETLSMFSKCTVC